MKKLLYYPILLILIGLLSSNIAAQESVTGKTKEIHLNLLTYNSYGLSFKTQTKKGNFFRIGLATFESDFKKNIIVPIPISYTNTINLSGAFEIGLEKRKELSERLTAFSGVNLYTSTSFSRYRKDDPTIPEVLRYTDDFSITPGLGFNSGFIFKITEDFLVSAEVIPLITYRYASHEWVEGQTKSKVITKTGTFGFNNQNVRVSLVYRWTKK